MQPEKRYDVSLSHNSADKAAVEYLAQRLRQEGMETFLDKWHLVPDLELLQVGIVRVKE